jgi:hypothetical protein
MHLKTATAFTLAGLMAGTALAQPSVSPGVQPDHSQPDARPENRQELPSDPAAAKKLIERRLDETVKHEERLRAALKDLEQGKAPADVLKEFEPHARDAVRDTRRPGDIDNRARTDRGPDRQARKITPEERAHALKFLHDASPVLGARFDDIIKKDPEYADRALGHMMGRIREAETAKERGNEWLYKLRVEEMEGGAAVIDAMRAFRAANSANPQDAAKLNAATEQLRAALSRQLDNRLSLQTNEIDSLTKRLADLKADLEKKSANRAATIDTMVAKVREGKDLRELGAGETSTPTEASRSVPPVAPKP